MVVYDQVTSRVKSGVKSVFGHATNQTKFIYGVAKDRVKNRAKKKAGKEGPYHSSGPVISKPLTPKRLYTHQRSLSDSDVQSLTGSMSDIRTASYPPSSKVCILA